MPKGHAKQEMLGKGNATAKEWLENELIQYFVMPRVKGNAMQRRSKGKYGRRARHARCRGPVRAVRTGGGGGEGGGGGNGIIIVRKQRRRCSDFGRMGGVGGGGGKVLSTEGSTTAITATAIVVIAPLLRAEGDQLTVLGIPR